MDTCPIIIPEGDIPGAAFQAQEEIGCQHTLEGKISVEWKGVSEPVL